MNDKTKNFIVKKQKKLIIIIISILLITIVFIGISFAKYFEQNIIKIDTKIAEPIIILENEKSIEISNAKKEGNVEFKVKNYNKEQQVTDVGLNYNIEIIAKEDSAIQYILYKDEKEIDIKNNKTQDIFLGKNGKEEHKYKLCIKYDEKLNQNLTDLIQDVQIKMHSEQEKVVI